MATEKGKCSMHNIEISDLLVTIVLSLKINIYIRDTLNKVLISTYLTLETHEI